MTLTVISRVQYLTAAASMRPADYDTIHLVHALKGSNVNPKQWAIVEVGGRRVSIKSTNQDLAIDWFAEWVAGIILAVPEWKQIALVPIPSSKTVEVSPADFRTAKIAAAVAERSNGRVTAAPVLRFRRPLPSASKENGPRDAETLYPEMVLTGAIPPGTVILIDDVKTSGGHLIAAAWKCEDVGRQPQLAVCGGCTSHDQLPDPFNVPIEELDVDR